MYSRISIKNFRGIESLEAEGLRRINLIVGRNNSGKTTFLESLFLLGGATSPLVPTTLGQLRGQRWGGSSPDPVWRPVFHNLDPRIPVEILGQQVGERQERKLRIEALEVSSFADSYEPSLGGEFGIAAATQDFDIGGLRLRYSGAPGNEVITNSIFDPKSGNIDAPSKDRDDFVRTTMLSARAYSSLARDAQQFSFLLKIKQEHDVLNGIHIIDRSVQRIEVVSEPSGPSIYLDVGLDALVPLAVGGEGLVRLFSIIVELTASRNGVLLIDEIDNGFHYSVMPSLWELLGELAEKHNVQLFGTTHNDDLMRSALEAFAEREGMLGLFRIDKRVDRHVMVAYSEEAMKGILEDNFEVRG
jgi:putative AbiEii toxin of type IV toxin-antitoxin system